MHDRFAEGVAFFNVGNYYDAHEAWEDVWHDSSGDERLWLQGLVQVAVALHHASVGNRLGAASVLQRAANNLSRCPEDMWRMNINRLREDVARNCGELKSDKELTKFVLSGSGPCHSEIT